MMIAELLKMENINLRTALEVRTYIPIAEKKAILEDILNKCFAVKDGILTCDYISKKIAFELAMVKYHTNLEIDTTSEEDYDALQAVILDLHDAYLEDYKDCQSLLNGMEQELRAKYSIESSIAQLSHKISHSIEGLVTLVAEKVDGFDMSAFGFDGAELDKFKKLLNKY